MIDFNYSFLVDSEEFRSIDISTAAPIPFYIGMNFQLQISSHWSPVKNVIVTKINPLHITRSSIRQIINVTTDLNYPLNKEN